jgi:hypothetical protein
MYTDLYRFASPIPEKKIMKAMVEAVRAAPLLVSGDRQRLLGARRIRYRFVLMFNRSTGTA